MNRASLDERPTVWTAAGMAVTVRRTDGVEVTTQLDRPFARVGAHSGGEVVLPGEDAGTKMLYLHVVGDQVFCLGIDHHAPNYPAQGRPKALSDPLPVGGCLLSASATAAPNVDAGAEPDGSADGDASAEQSGPRLRILGPDGRLAATHTIRRMLTLVGHSLPSRLRLRAERVSRIHCVLYWDGAALWVVDLLSTHGTLLNGAPIVSSQVAPGDLLGIGACALEYAENGAGESLGGDSTISAPRNSAGVEHDDSQAPLAADFGEEPPSADESRADSGAPAQRREAGEQQAAMRRDLEERARLLDEAMRERRRMAEELLSARREADALRQELADQCEQLTRTLAEAHSHAQWSAASLAEVKRAAAAEVAELRQQLAEALEQSQRAHQNLTAAQVEILSLRPALATAERRLREAATAAAAGSHCVDPSAGHDPKDRAGEAPADGGQAIETAARGEPPANLPEVEPQTQAVALAGPLEVGWESSPPAVPVATSRELTDELPDRAHVESAGPASRDKPRLPAPPADGPDSPAIDRNQTGFDRLLEQSARRELSLRKRRLIVASLLFVGAAVASGLTLAYFRPAIQALFQP